MRVLGKKIDLDYTEVKEFFRKRSEKFCEDNPYSVTMYQDNNPDLVIKRNERETEKLLPLLNLSSDSKVLDVACGVGRWADAIKCNIKRYVGLDFSDELIEIAKRRNVKENYRFEVGDARCLEKNRSVIEEKYNIILMMGISIYLNDNDLEHCLSIIEKTCEKHARICIREPIGIKERLTLKEYFSSELDDNYNVIYRTRSELLNFYDSILLQREFSILQEGFLFNEDELNNRKETCQYYFLLER